MLKGKRGYSARLFEWWTDSIRRHPVLAVVISLLATAVVLAYTVKHFRIDTDLSNMISDKLPYRKLEKEFQRAFPQLGNTIVVIIDAETPEAAHLQQRRMADQLKKTGLFKKVEMPGSEAFFEKNGLLYLSVEELQELSDNLANAQPLLGLLSQDFSLRGLFSVLEKVLSQEGGPEQRERLLPFFDRLRQAFESAVSDRPFQISWQDLIFGKEASRGDANRFIILEPVMDENDLSAAEASLEAVHRIRNELGLDGAGGVKARLTGDVVLDHENLLAVRSSMGMSTLISFLLVAFSLVIGLGSWRLVFASLVTLLVGLLWTFGFAIAFIGHLNLISVTFTVLFIGIGIDYGIQFCLRYRELILSGLGHDEAILKTAKGLGVGLRLCTVAAAIGFYSFLPTAYTGVSELGLIAGTGMLINLFATLTVLPALLTLLPLKKEKAKEFASGKPLYLFPYKHSKAIRVGAIAAAIVSLFFVPRLSFDDNPLNLYDPHSEAVLTMKGLFEDGKTPPWTISVLAKDAKEAEEVAGRLKGLKEVKEVVTLADLVPDHQAEKMAIISDITLFMPPGMKALRLERLSYGEKAESLRGFEKALKNALSRSPGVGSLRSLHDSVTRLEEAFRNRENGKEALDRLEDALLSNLPPLFDRLEASLQAHPFGESALPEKIHRQYVTPEGRYRVEVIPRENILKAGALGRFVDVVTAVAPNAIDTPVTIRKAGKAVVSSFLQATLYAILAITLYLLIELRSLSDTGLILLPLTLTLLLTAAASVLLHIPFNFANVIVVPLLLGSGVEGTYFIYRFRTEPPSSGNMLETSTARALFFSTLTTILSFSALSFASHRGMASMGKLLTLCIAFLMITTLVLLPVLLKSAKGGTKERGEST